MQPPLQPAKTEYAAGVAVSVTVVPRGNDAEHAALQSMPAGELITVPWPKPEKLMGSVAAGTGTGSCTLSMTADTTVSAVFRNAKR